MPTTGLRVSVVVPTLNPTMIDQTLAALMAQSYPSDLVEILVVGRDERGLVRENERVRFIDTGQPVSAARARNIGLFAAQGEVVCFTDDDCVPDTHWLAELLRHYADPAVFVVGGAMSLPLKGYWATCDAVASAYEQLYFQPPGSRRQLPSLNFSARRSVLLAVNGFDESFPKAAGEDSHLCARLRQVGYSLHFEPRAIVHHLGWRKTWLTVLGHAHLFGRYSLWIRPDMVRFIQPPRFMRHWASMLIATPFLAGWITGRMYLRQTAMRRRWALLPGLLLVQIAWGLGVTRSLWARARGEAI